MFPYPEEIPQLPPPHHFGTTALVGSKIGLGCSLYSVVHHNIMILSHTDSSHYNLLTPECAVKHPLCFFPKKSYPSKCTGQQSFFYLKSYTYIWVVA